MLKTRAADFADGADEMPNRALALPTSSNTKGSGLKCKEMQAADFADGADEIPNASCAQYDTLPTTTGVSLAGER